MRKYEGNRDSDPSEISIFLMSYPHRSFSFSHLLCLYYISDSRTCIRNSERRELFRSRAVIAADKCSLAFHASNLLRRHAASSDFVRIDKSAVLRWSLY